MNTGTTFTPDKLSKQYTVYVSLIYLQEYWSFQNLIEKHDVTHICYLSQI